MSTRATNECPELVILALEDLTIEIKLIEQLVLGIASIADHVHGSLESLPSREQTH